MQARMNVSWRPSLINTTLGVGQAISIDLLGATPIHMQQDTKRTISATVLIIVDMKYGVCWSHLLFDVDTAAVIKVLLKHCATFGSLVLCVADRGTQLQPENLAVQLQGSGEPMFKECHFTAARALSQCHNPAERKIQDFKASLRKALDLSRSSTFPLLSYHDMETLTAFCCRTINNIPICRTTDGEYLCPADFITAGTNTVESKFITKAKERSKVVYCVQSTHRNHMMSHTTNMSPTNRLPHL